MIFAAVWRLSVLYSIMVLFPSLLQRCFKCSQCLGLVAQAAFSTVGVVSLLLAYILATAVIIANVDSGRGTLSHTNEGRKGLH